MYPDQLPTESGVLTKLADWIERAAQLASRYRMFDEMGLAERHSTKKQLQELRKRLSAERPEAGSTD